MSSIGGAMVDEVKLLTFQELGLRFGHELDLLPNPGETDLIFPCELIGCLKDDCLIVGPPASSGVLPRLAEGQRVVVRVKLAGGIALFPSTVLCVSEVPVVMVFLDYPRDIKFRQVRGAFRVDVVMPVLATNQTDRRFTSVPGKIVDISLTGARLEMFEELGIVGQDIVIKGKFSLGSIQRLLQIDAVIRARSVKEKMFVYGVEFSGTDEDRIMVLMGLTFQAMAVGNLQTIR